MQFHHTDDAPPAIGPYSQAVEIDGWLYLSGQVALDPATGELIDGDFDTEARQVLKNLTAVLASAGCTFANIVRATIYLIDWDDFPRINQLYGEALGDHRPARTTIEVSKLPKGAKVEIDLVARVPAGEA
jgi:2-iminobutanoate/2-iminopropanoate deaminase